MKDSVLDGPVKESFGKMLDENYMAFLRSDLDLGYNNDAREDAPYHVTVASQSMDQGGAPDQTTWLGVERSARG